MLQDIFGKRRVKVGAPPGTLALPEQAPPPKVHVIHYHGPDITESDVTRADELREALSDASVTWIDVQGFGDGTLIRAIGERFGFHPLLLEDIVNVPQRPKSEAYENQLLMIVRMVQLGGPHEIDLEQVSVVMGKNYVFTFQERYGDVFDPVRKRIREGTGRLRTHGADYLAYALVDTVIDAYYPVLEKIGDRLEHLEDEVVTNPSPDLLGQLNRLKNRLANLRRGIWPQREAVSALARGDHDMVSPEVQLFYRDTYDHCVHTSEVTEMYREMVSGLVNTYLSSIANRTNDVMKVLTVVATIFIPLTFIAGIYGMNFDNMPELHVWWAYPLIWAAMVAVAGAMVALFWRKGWIGPQDSSARTTRHPDD